MPDGKYRDRRQEIIFTSAEERNSWLADAKKIYLPFSKYILEMARRGREREASRPPGAEQATELAEFREANQELRHKLRDAEKLLSHAEEELFKLRHEERVTKSPLR